MSAGGSGNTPSDWRSALIRPSRYASHCRRVDTAANAADSRSFASRVRRAPAVAIILGKALVRGSSGGNTVGATAAKSAATEQRASAVPQAAGRIGERDMGPPRPLREYTPASYQLRSALRVEKRARL